MLHNWHWQQQEFTSQAARARKGAARQDGGDEGKGGRTHRSFQWSLNVFEGCGEPPETAAQLQSSTWSLLRCYVRCGGETRITFLFWPQVIKSSLHVTRPWNNRIWRALLWKLGCLPGHHCQPASHKCFMWCWYGNHRISTMTPCESWITMAVFQACVTLDTVQLPQVWISLKPPPLPKKCGIQ